MTDAHRISARIGPESKTEMTHARLSLLVMILSSKVAKIRKRKREVRYATRSRVDSVY